MLYFEGMLLKSEKNSTWQGHFKMQKPIVKQLQRQIKVHHLVVVKKMELYSWAKRIKQGNLD